MKVVSCGRQVLELDVWQERLCRVAAVGCCTRFTGGGSNALKKKPHLCRQFNLCESLSTCKCEALWSTMRRGHFPNWRSVAECYMWGNPRGVLDKETVNNLSVGLTDISSRRLTRNLAWEEKTVLTQGGPRLSPWRNERPYRPARWQPLCVSSMRQGWYFGGRRPCYVYLSLYMLWCNGWASFAANHSLRQES
ncbi:hypothetical protein TGME49_296340 [Toxoplasma gondii ME49]|uniref:Uncharacterized protein n=2 Tax=Toxoplasma gondii TaxID=5811 RepID=S8GRE9_TOXGM|nr:hypothetical protein TGME49_296340 [Toxoplasma gondii ME49]EPT31164.1 hypothetical protein TGME49_296340 [Toxoplasma gondii ME49]KYF43603.1 hypothetical protein TGARI_296340 [Toxoplasma gondii ARI]|eukprot:XP_018637850.1 hypothetical protein TGME49_296340 [Toxoplasma gondii ME49]